MTGGFGPNSELRMPACADASETAFDASIPHGTLHDTIITSATLGNSRTMRVYLPPGYARSQDRYPVIVFHDGLDYITLGAADNILDYLIAQRSIEPVIAVFVPAVDRSAEYAGEHMSLYAAFIVEDVLGSVDRSYRTNTDSRTRATLGASDGGNFSLYLGANHPETFGLIGAQSSNVVRSVSDAVARAERLPLRLYLDLGTYDIPVLIPRVRNFVSQIQSKGYDYLYREYHEGHSWGNWRAHLDEALIYFYGTAVSGGDPARPSPPPH